MTWRMMMNDEEREARDAKEDYESEQYDVEKDRAAQEAYELMYNQYLQE